MNNSPKRSWGKAGGRQIEGWGDEQREWERARRGRQHGEKNDSKERGVFEGITYERVKENVREGGWRQ